MVVIALSGVVPFTCRIPKQIDSDRKKLEERRSISFRNLTATPPDKNVVAEQLERMQLLHISWSLGLSSSAWDWLGGQLPGLPTAILKKRVAKRVEYLKNDDYLIVKGGGVEEMNIEEVKIALVERGLNVLGKDEQALRSSLEAWILARKGESVERLLLTR